MLGPQAPLPVGPAQPGPRPLAALHAPRGCAVSGSRAHRPQEGRRKTLSEPQEALRSPLFREHFLFFQARKTLKMTATPLRDPVSQNHTI